MTHLALMIDDTALHPFGVKEYVSCEHGCDAWDLFFLVHHVISGRVGLEVEGYFPGDAGQDGEEVTGAGLAGQNVAESLNEPRSCRCVSPRIKSRNCGIGDQEIGMTGNLVAHGVGVGLSVGDPLEMNSTIQLISLTCLNEEQFRFSRQRWTLLCVEMTPQTIWFVSVIGGVEDAHLAVAQNGNEKTISIMVIFLRTVLKETLHFLERQIIKDPNFEIQ